jgi:hypothetical protein
MTAEPAAREPRLVASVSSSTTRRGQITPDSPDTRGDMDVPTTPLHHHARGRHDQPLGRERRHQVPRSRRSPRSVRHRPRYRPMQRCQDPGPIQRLAPRRSGQDPKAAGMWSSRFRKDDRSSTTLPRLASGCLKARFFVASSMRARSEPVIHIDDHALSLKEFGGLLRTTRSGACESCSSKTTMPTLRSSRYETSRTETRLTIGADPGDSRSAPSTQAPRVEPGLVPRFSSRPRVNAPSSR